MDDLIYNQYALPKDAYRYGLRSSADTGCGWIAVYNALRLMGYGVDRVALIRYFEGQLPLIHGNFGTCFWGPGLYFRKWGFPVGMLTKTAEFDRAAKEADVCILFYRWRKGLRMGAHFVALRHTPAGFVGYNTYRGSVGPDSYGESLAGFLKGQGYFGSVLFPIRRRAEKNAPQGGAETL